MHAQGLAAGEQQRRTRGHGSRRAPSLRESELLTMRVELLMRLGGMMRVACLLFLLLLDPSAAFAAQRLEVPIKQTVLTNGSIRYSIPVAVAGSRPLDVMLDTGSTGLRMLPGAFPDSAYTPTNQPSVYGYGSGVRLNGVLAKIPVSLGGTAAPVSIPAQLVQKVDCFPEKPKCPASRLSQADYGIGGDGLPRQGFRGIIGIATARGPVDNPLIVTGAQTWIVVLPRPGEADPGKLIISPDPSELAGYVRVAITGEGGMHDDIHGCLALEKIQKMICGSMLLDTGAPGIHIGSSDASQTQGWTKGDPIAVILQGIRGGQARAGFKAGDNQPSRISASLDPKLTQASITAGTEPYFLFSVLYDVEHNAIGFKPR
jgi:hypothetical protein